MLKYIIEILIRCFLNDYELKLTNDIENLEDRLDFSIARENQLRIRLTNQSDVIRHLEQVIATNNVSTEGRGLMEQIRIQTRTTSGSNNNIYKNFGKRSNTLRAIKSPTKNCQWICIHNVQSLIKNDDRDNIIEEFTKYGNKKMVLVDINENVLNEILNIFEKTHTIRFQKEYTNSNNSKMILIMFHLRGKYQKKWFQENSMMWHPTPPMPGFFSHLMARKLYDLSSHELELRGQTVKKKQIKPRPLSWEDQTKGLKAMSFNYTNKLPTKYEQQVNETQEEFDLRMKKLKQEEHQQRMLSGFQSCSISNVNLQNLK